MPLLVAILADFPEEGWPSMDLVANRLMDELQHFPGELVPTLFRPGMIRRFRRLPFTSRSHFAFNLDRIANRFWDYPRVLRNGSRGFDIYHIVDHSYAQLAHELPGHRTVITCHDLDTFNSVLHPHLENRTAIYRAMTKRILKGFTKAARIVCDTHAIAAQLIDCGIVPADRISVNHNGVDSDLLMETDTRTRSFVDRWLPHDPQALRFLHVGSTIPRKRIEMLLAILREMKTIYPHARLIRVGGDFTSSQKKLMECSGLTESVTTLPMIDRAALGEVYRRSTVLLLPSEREGFGLPVVEAMACGTPVAVSDIPALREVGGTAAAYCEINNISSWVQTLSELIGERDHRPEKWAIRKQNGIARAGEFTWTKYARHLVNIYGQLANGD